MKFIDLMNELGRNTGIGQVAPDETGSVTLLFDNEHEITFMPEEGGDAVFLQCEISDASRLDSNGCRALLEASFSQTDGAAFAIHHELDKVVLWKRYGEFASYAELEKAVNDFFGLAVVWKKCLASNDFSSQGASDVSSPFTAASTVNFIQV